MNQRNSTNQGKCMDIQHLRLLFVNFGSCVVVLGATPLFLEQSSCNYKKNSACIVSRPDVCEFWVWVCPDVSSFLTNVWLRD